MNSPLAPEPVLRAALRVLHFAGHVTRNWTARQDFSREQIQDLWEAVHGIPETLCRWQGDESLHEVRERLREYDQRWSFPQLDEVFREGLNGPKA